MIENPNYLGFGGLWKLLCFQRADCTINTGFKLELGWNIPQVFYDVVLPLLKMWTIGVF